MSRSIEVSYSRPKAQEVNVRKGSFGRKAAGVLLTTLAVLGGAHVAKGIEHHVDHMNHISEIIQHPKDMKKGTYEVVTVQPGDTGNGMAAEYSDVPDDEAAISQQIMSQTDKNGNLQPGQKVEIAKTFIDRTPKPQH